MYSMEVSILTVSIIVGDDALGVPFGRAMPCFYCLLLNLYKSIVYRRFIIVYRNKYFWLTIGSVCDTILIVK